MEPVAEDNSDNVTPWLGSEGSQELCASESITDSYYEDDGSDAEFPLDHLPPARESPDSHQPHDWEVARDQRSLPEYSGSEGGASYREEEGEEEEEEEDMYLSSSREFTRGSPSVQTPPTSLSPHPAYPDSGQRSLPHSHSSSSSLGCAAAAADMTLALTLDADQPQRASNRQFPECLNREGDSSEEGGSSQAPPASVSFGILDEGAEQAEKWNSESDTVLCRPNSNRARCTRISHNESQSEKQAKENKSKCKQIAQILTNAPNPQNKGAVLFKKRQQRVKKFTLVSYGTGDSRVESEDQVEEETQEVRSAEYNFVATSESEFEEEYSVQQQQQQHNLSVNWGSIHKMEALPGTKGKGVFMFAQRRQRIDQIVSEQDELRNRGIPAETSPIPRHRGAQDFYDNEKLYASTDQGTYMNVNYGQQVESHESLQPVNQLLNVSKPTVPNRTAKPFPSFKSRANVGNPVGIIQESKKHDLIFKVPVYAKTNPQVWSPTGDIIASRDERISVPAIKTGVLAESKRRVSSKQSSMPQAVHYQNKGDRRSYIEPEEDGFSLGAEACNFMQPRTIKLKNPPPVAPKPSIDPSCPPWMRRSPSGEPFFPSRSPVSQPRQSPVGPQAQHYLQQQQDWTQPQQTANHWDLNQTPAAPQTTADAWAPVKPSSQPPLLSTANSWNQHPQQVSVSMHACSPSYSPHRPASPKSKPDSAPHSVASVASCPPEAGKSYGQPLKPLKASPMGRGAGRTEIGPVMVGKGTEQFEKKLTRVGKFVAGVETGNTNNAGAASPTLSLPNHWRYSPNVRAPPPLSYNPILAPFYPPSATKQLPSTSPKIKPKPKPVPKQLNTLDIMKHQPYHLDTSLFKYDAVPEVKSPSPRPTPASKFEATKKRKERSASSLSSDNTSVQTKAEVPAKSAAQVGSSSRKTHGTSSILTPAPTDVNNKQTAPASRPASTTSQKSSTSDSVASAFSPSSLIARGARQMAPKPNFCAKKPVVMGPQWRPVTMLHSF